MPRCCITAAADWATGAAGAAAAAAVAVVASCAAVVSAKTWNIAIRSDAREIPGGRTHNTGRAREPGADSASQWLLLLLLPTYLPTYLPPSALSPLLRSVDDDWHSAKEQVGSRMGRAVDVGHRWPTSGALPSSHTRRWRCVDKRSASIGSDVEADDNAIATRPSRWSLSIRLMLPSLSVLGVSLSLSLSLSSAPLSDSLLLTPNWDSVSHHFALSADAMTLAPIEGTIVNYQAYNPNQPRTPVTVNITQHIAHIYATHPNSFGYICTDAGGTKKNNRQRARAAAVCLLRVRGVAMGPCFFLCVSKVC